VSCYIRFTNFSAGDGWGSQFIPRVNTEVIEVIGTKVGVFNANGTPKGYAA